MFFTGSARPSTLPPCLHPPSSSTHKIPWGKNDTKTSYRKAQVLPLRHWTIHSRMLYAISGNSNSLSPLTVIVGQGSLEGFRNLKAGENAPQGKPDARRSLSRTEVCSRECDRLLRGSQASPNSWGENSLTSPNFHMTFRDPLQPSAYRMAHYLIILL